MLLRQHFVLLRMETTSVIFLSWKIQASLHVFLNKLCCAGFHLLGFISPVIWEDKHENPAQWIVVVFADVLRPLFAQEHPFINNALCLNVSVGLILFWWEHITVRGVAWPAWILCFRWAKAGNIFPKWVVMECCLSAVRLSGFMFLWRAVTATLSGFMCKYNTHTKTGKVKLIVQPTSTQMNAEFFTYSGLVLIWSERHFSQSCSVCVTGSVDLEGITV